VLRGVVMAGVLACSPLYVQAGEARDGSHDFDFEADGPDGHWEGATLFVYNTKAKQWSQTYIDGDSGEMESPTVGSFKDGRGEFFGTTVYKGGTVLTRGVWSDIKPNSHRFEISYSRDGGRTWVTAFKADLTRLK
jgi:hypothetical protein